MGHSETIPEADTLLAAKRELLEKCLQGGLVEILPELNRIPPITPRTSSGPAPLSFAQQQVWIHSLLSPDLPIYNEPFTVLRYGSLDVTALERSLAEIIRRHEAWRTTFSELDGRPLQVVHPAPDIVKLPVIDLRKLPPDEREAEARKVAANDAQRPFDLARGPLIRAKLVRVGNAEYRLYLTLHQIILDGVTAYHVLLPELTALYEAFSVDKPSPLPELPFQYADFACWQRQWMTSETFAGQLAYWREQLAGELPTLDLAADRPRAATQTFRGAMYRLQIPKSLVDKVRRLTQREGATLFMGMLSGFYALLHRYTGQSDLLLGSVTASRKDPGLDKLLGYFVNPVVLRANVGGDPSFLELLNRVRDSVLGALSHDDVPFEYLVQELHPQRDLSRNPLFQIMMSIEPPIPPVDGWSMTQFDVSSGASKFDLYLDLDDREEGIIGPVTYNPDLFDEETIARMVGHWQRLLEAVVAHPTRRLSELPLLTSSETQQLLVEWNDTAVSRGRSSVAGLFEAQAKQTPDRIAVEDEHSEISYGVLNQRANQLAHYLRSVGVGAGVLVGICTTRSQEMIVALLGVLKAGGAYVPLDPAYPRERLGFMLQDSGMHVLLSEESLLASLPASQAELICLDRDEELIVQQSTENLGQEPGKDELAYVIYTSGSTGRPKGVQITQGALVNLLLTMEQEPGLTAQDKLLAVTTLSFDIAALELFLPLITGARLVLVGGETSRDGARLARRLSDCGATVMQATPTTWRLLLEAGWQGDGRLRGWCGGEALGRDLAEALLARCHSVWNLYGPTETTIWSAVSQVQSGTQAVDLGHPVANTEFYVLDGQLQLLPVGVPGELHIGGLGLARGYLNQPELTRERFISHPFRREAEARLYKTGDLVRRLADGRLEFLGRLDNQVKVRGFRIELGEIEKVLGEHEGLKAVVVDARPDGSGEKQLVAYVVVQVPRAPSGAELRRFLRQRLPDYMLPAHLVFLDSLPLTPNGKINRRALPAPDLAISPHGQELVLPRTEQERKLAAIWEAVLGISPIGVHQNFFDLGGHSLLAAKLSARIEKTFGKKLSLAEVFGASTIAEISMLLDDERINQEFSGIIPIQPHGSKPPLFWVRGGALFLPLARRLGPDQPSLGLHLPSMEARQFPRHCTLEEIGSALVRKLRQVQPAGPYYLAGLCVNGVLAYEMACQLAAKGQQIALLAMFDAHNPVCYRDYSQEGRYQVLTQQMRFHLQKLTRLHLGDLSSYVEERFKGVRRRWDRVRWQLAYDRGWNGREDLQDLDRIVHPAAVVYRPRPYDGKVIFFQTTDWPTGHYWNLQLGWTDLARLEFQRIQGEHESIFHEANVEPLAKKLMHYLRETRNDPEQLPGWAK